MGRGAYPSLRRQHGVLLREVDCYRGRVDVVQAVFPRRLRSAALRGIGRVLIQPSAAAAIAHVPAKGSRTIEELRSLTGYSVDVLRRRVAELVDNGLLAMTRDGGIRR